MNRSRETGALHPLGAMRPGRKVRGRNRVEVHGSFALWATATPRQRVRAVREGDGCCFSVLFCDSDASQKQSLCEQHRGCEREENRAWNRSFFFSFTLNIIGGARDRAAHEGEG